MAIFRSGLEYDLNVLFAYRPKTNSWLNWYFVFKNSWFLNIVFFFEMVMICPFLFFFIFDVDDFLMYINSFFKIVYNHLIDQVYYKYFVFKSSWFFFFFLRVLEYRFLLRDDDYFSFNFFSSFWYLPFFKNICMLSFLCIFTSFFFNNHLIAQICFALSTKTRITRMTFQRKWSVHSAS